MAMQNRPELKSLKVDLRTQDLNVGYTKNQLLPRLDLTASYYSPGISGDRIVYQDTPPDGSDHRRRARSGQECHEGRLQPQVQ